MSRNRESPQEIESQRQESLREMEADGGKRPGLEAFLSRDIWLP